jgi:hypothetical protein
MLTRRTTLGLMAASLAAGRSARSAEAVVYRNSVNSLYPNSPEMEALRAAIPQMRQSGFWDRQVSIHSRDWHQHHSWLFLPWHRAFLLQFEREVRRLTYDGFRMPYLDWDADRIPAMLYEPPFAHDGRTHGPDDSLSAFQGTDGQRFSESAPYGFTSFFGEPNFGGDDESYGHNLVHVFVGGDMGNIPTAPRDPLFWFHHANVDRLWWYWSNLNGCDSANCYSSEWVSARLNGIEDPDGRPLRSLTPASVISTTALGYDYREFPRLRSVGPGAAGAASKALSSVSRSLSLKLLGSPSRSTTLSLPPDFVLQLLASARAKVEALLSVRSNGTSSHRIAISLIGRETLHQAEIYAMPMGEMASGMESSCSYVKNIGFMFEALAQSMSRDEARLRQAAERFALRVEALPIENIESAALPLLTECTCRIESRIWR